MTQTRARESKKVRHLDADLLTRREIEALLAACSSRAPTGVRNRALIALMWRSGLRVGEALALQAKDLDLEQGLVVVQHGKGDKRRVLGLDAGTVEFLRRWLDARRARGLPRTAPVFCTLRGATIDSSYIRHLFPRLARRAGIEKRVHAHALRHAFAPNLSKRERHSRRSGIALVTPRQPLRIATCVE